jgi:hypothetical protein
VPDGNRIECKESNSRTSSLNILSGAPGGNPFENGAEQTAYFQAKVFIDSARALPAYQERSGRSFNRIISVMRAPVKKAIDIDAYSLLCPGDAKLVVDKDPAMAASMAAPKRILVTRRWAFLPRREASLATL